jgi:ketosteroid isomerase-like protein
MTKTKSRLFTGGALVLLAFSIRLPILAEITSSDKAIRDLIATYAAALDRADTSMANQIFSNAPEVTSIHPRGEEHGRQQIMTNVFQNLMGETSSARKLVPRDISVQVYGDTAWSEFNWDFVATVRKDGSPFHSQGRETQIYLRENGQWRIVHVHYSGAPVTANLKGFLTRVVQCS